MGEEEKEGAGGKRYLEKKSVLDEFEAELALASRETPSKDDDGLGELMAKFDDGKLKSPELVQEQEEEIEDEALAERRRQIILRIREIMASNARNRADQLRALLAIAPAGMEHMMNEIIQKYTAALNEPAPQPEAPAKIETQTGTIMEAYRPAEEKRANPYGGGDSSGPSLYSQRSEQDDESRFRPGMDTGADAAVRRMLGKDRPDEERA